MGDFTAADVRKYVEASYSFSSTPTDNIGSIVFPDDLAVVNVRVKPGQAPTNLAAYQRGSNLCLALIEKESGLVSLAHVLWHGGTKVPAEGAVDVLLREMWPYGAKVDNLGAVLVGQSTMPNYVEKRDAVRLANTLGIEQPENEIELGDDDAILVDPRPSRYETENAAIIKAALEAAGIPLVVEDLGGTLPRDVLVKTTSDIEEVGEEGKAGAEKTRYWRAKVHIYKLQPEGLGYLRRSGAVDDLAAMSAMTELARQRTTD
jgi:chemotaxis receptor (MCP) glutamine deamidase CheD